MRLLAAAIALACLTGCVSPEEWHRRDTVACVHYWFRPGTDSMASCMMTREEGRRVGIGLLPLQPPQQPNMDAVPLPQGTATRATDPRARRRGSDDSLALIVRRRSISPATATPGGA